MRLTAVVTVAVVGLLLLASCANTSLPTPAIEQTSAEQPHECDTQAAHPNDVLRVAAGKLDEDVIPVLALRACSAATKQFPNESRFHFQLGRALLALQRADEAAKAFETAASMGNAPAKFYLAETELAAYWDSYSEAPPEEVVRMLDEIDESFAPAAERLKQIVFRTEGFQFPLIIEALHDKDYERLNRVRILVALYALGMHEFLATKWNPTDHNCPAYVVQPAITYDLDRAVAGDPRNPIEGVAYTVAFSAASWAGKVLIDSTWRGDREKWQDYYKSLGARDGQYLASEFGCQSPVTRRIYDNLVEFSKMKRPLAEYAEGLLNGEGKELFLAPPKHEAEKPKA